eukprot:6177161-Pleurochrysis_carterae.AAC.2
MLCNICENTTGYSYILGIGISRTGATQVAIQLKIRYPGGYWFCLRHRLFMFDKMGELSGLRDNDQVVD